jgi:hypothetical protein
MSELNHESAQGVHPVDKEIIWGAKAIAPIIRRSPRQTHYLLSKGLVPGQGQMGGLYFLSLPAFSRAVHGEAA